jgi:hypothetical protein
MVSIRQPRPRCQSPSAGCSIVSIAANAGNTGIGRTRYDLEFPGLTGISGKLMEMSILALLWF